MILRSVVMFGSSGKEGYRDRSLSPIPRPVIPHHSWPNCPIKFQLLHMVCSLLRVYPHLSGIVFDLPDVVAETDALWVHKLGLESRCHYVGGDMFKEVPKAN